MPIHIVILAAGQGTRMQSNIPKVLHLLGGVPLLTRVIETAQTLQPETIHVVYGYGGDLIREQLKHLDVNWVLQEQLLGTGHAVAQALQFIPEQAQVLVLSGDVPLIEADTLSRLTTSIEQHQSLSLLIANVSNPNGLGRILRNPVNDIEAIIEERDASDTERRITEIYAGMCCANAKDLMRWLPMLSKNNAQGEYYLTEIVNFAKAEHQRIYDVHPSHIYEIQGINDRLQLQNLERVWQEKQANRLLLSGVSLADAKRFDLRGTLQCGHDVSIDINCIIEGTVIIGNGCTIAANCILKNVILGDQVVIHTHSVLDGCHIGDYTQIGPFARLRPGTKLAARCKIGNFVETKNVEFAENSKANHLSYLGDARIGQAVNIGAGTITCNYDGINKYQTIIEDGAFIGSDTQLVAPVRIGAYATIGAGSTIRKDAPAHALTLTVSQQKTIPGWQRHLKKAR